MEQNKEELELPKKINGNKDVKNNNIKGIEKLKSKKMKEIICFIALIFVFLIIDVAIFSFYKIDFSSINLILVPFLFGIVLPFAITRTDSINAIKIIYLLVMLASHYYLLIDSFKDFSRDCEPGFDCLSSSLSPLVPFFIMPIIFAIATVIYLIFKPSKKIIE